MELKQLYSLNLIINKITIESLNHSLEKEIVEKKHICFSKKITNFSTYTFL